MLLEDKDIFDINKKLINLRESKFYVSREAEKNIPLNKKQAFILFCFSMSFFSVFVHLSYLLFSHLNLCIDTYASYRASSGLCIGSFLSSCALLSLFLYPLFANHDEFQKRFNSIYSFIETTLMCFFSGLIFSLLGGILYFLSVGFLLLTLKNNFDFNIQEINNWFLCIAAFSFIAFYLKKNELPFVKNKSEQQQYINERKNKLLPEIKRIENKEESLRQKIIDSVTNIDELAYFKHFLRNSKVVEINLLQKAIEEKILKNSSYNSFEDYEKEILIERLNKNIIINH